MVPILQQHYPQGFSNQFSHQHQQQQRGHKLIPRENFYWTHSMANNVLIRREQELLRVRLLETTSADELDAANVLVNLLASPKVPPRRFRSVESPSAFRPVVPSSHRAMWGNNVSTPASRNYKSDWSLSSSSNHSRSDSGDSYSSDGSVAESCKTSSPPPLPQLLSSSSSVTPPPQISQQDQQDQWYSGSTSLSLSEDDDVLSPLHCFMRRYCVEAFSATPEDVATPRYGKSHGVKVVVGQVGIRCLYCKHRSVGKRPERAVCYPSSLRNIYHSIETWQRRHSLVCTDIAPWVKQSMTELMHSSRSRAGGRRQYWEDSAKRVGMVDTDHGVRFSRPPGDLGICTTIRRSTCSNDNQDNLIFQRVADAPPSQPVVRDQDRPMITDYLYLLMEQMETCQFTEEDRTGGRSKIKDNQVGFPGMQCRHCRGKAGFGRYFPASVNALALANSDRNIYNHIQKCRRCPPQIKAELIRQSQQQSHCKNKRGLRKLFFKRVWGRMHSNVNNSD